MILRPVKKSCAHECALSKDTLIMNYIAKIISTTWGVESKNNRLKVIVEKAKEIYWG